MNILDQAGNSTNLSFFYQNTQSQTLSYQKTNASGTQDLEISASESSSVTLSGQYQPNLTYAPSGVDKTQPISPESPNSQAANNILSFIAQRLEQDFNDGASEEELQSRLQAGYEGFLKGYGEAFDQLAATGLLGEEVEETIGQTFDAVLAGIDKLAEKYGMESPVDASLLEDTPEEQPAISAVPYSEVNFGQSTIQSGSVQNVFADFADSLVKPGENLEQLLEASNINYEGFAERNFSFEMTTKDGDVVTIRASSSYQESGSYTAVNYRGEAGSAALSRSANDSSASNAFSLNVDGELDADELSAINDLLSQVGDLSQTFYSGNIEQAFSQALEIGFDETEIAGFSLNLRQEVSTRVEASYAAIQDMAPKYDMNQKGKSDNFALPENHHIAQMARFVEMLKQTTDFAEKIGIEPAELPKIADFVSRGQSDNNNGNTKFSDMVERLIDAA